MTRADAVRNCLQKVVDMSSDAQLAEWLLSLARSRVVDASEMYALWCDNQGACKNADCGDICDCCTDEEHINCIRRFLSAEYTPS